MILSTLMLSDTGVSWNIESTPVKAAGFYGKTPPLHTVSFSLNNFVGRFYILATLENTVKEADDNNGWFPIILDHVNSTSYIEFPLEKDKLKPSLGLYGYQTTETFCQTFVGNFTFIKVQLQRDYLKNSAIQPISSSDQTSVGRISAAHINF